MNGNQNFGIGEMLQTCRGNRTIFFPAVSLYEANNDEYGHLLFFESGYNGACENRTCKRNIDGESRDIHEVFFPLQMPTQFDGLNIKMKRFTPNEDCWCGMNDVTDIFDLKTHDDSGDELVYHATYFERIAMKHAKVRNFNNEQKREDALNEELDDLMGTLTPLYPNDEDNLKKLRQVLFQNEPMLANHGRYDQNLFDKFRTLVLQGYFSYLPDDFLSWVRHINAKVDVAATPLLDYSYESYQKSYIDKNTVYSHRKAFELVRRNQEEAMNGYVNLLIETVHKLQIPYGSELENLYVSFGDFASGITCAKTTGVVDKYVDTVSQEGADITKLLSPLLLLKCRIAQKKFMIVQKASINSSADKEDVYMTMPEVTQFILDLQPELICMPMSTTKSMLSFDNMIKERDAMTNVNMEYVLQSVKEYKNSMTQLNLDHPEIVSVVQDQAVFGFPYIKMATPVALELFHKYHATIHAIMQERYPDFNNINLWRFDYDCENGVW